MKFEVISLFISSLIGALSIGASVWVLVFQSRNNKDIENIKHGLSIKGRIFEDKYSKTMQVLEKMGLYRIKLSEFNSFKNCLESINKDSVKTADKLFNELVHIRNNFIAYSYTCRYWIGEELLTITNEMNKSTYKVSIELIKVCDGINRINKTLNIFDVSTKEEIFGDYDSDKVNQLLEEIKYQIIKFEDICIKRFK